MDDWELDLLDLAEAPAPKKKKKEKKKRKRESSGSNSDMELAGSGSDMDLQGDSDEDGSAQEDAEDGELRPDMFPVDGIYKSTTERAELMERNEMEREMILEERREKLQAYQDRQALKQMVADQDGVSVGSDSDDRPRRRAPVSKRAKQLEVLKQKRKSKSEREEKRAKRRAGGSDYDSSEEENKARRSPSVPVYTDSEEEEDAEFDKDEKTSTKKKGKSREPATQEELVTICIPRAKLAQYWPCPWFPEYVEGAYVRMGVGQENGQPVYRLAKVEKVADNKASRLYKLEKNVTDVKLTLIIGDDKKDMTMEMVSNSPPTDREFNRYMAVLKSKDLEPPTKTEVAAKLENLQKYKDAVLTEHDISLILAKKKEYAKGNIHDRHTLRNERDIAIRSGNAEAVARLDRVLAELDGKYSQPAPNGSSSMAQQNRAPLTLEERRKNLAMASMGVGTPKAVAGKTASPSISKPASGANTPQRQAAASASAVSVPHDSSKAASQPSQSGDQPKQNKFQKLLASKVEIDLGDF